MDELMMRSDEASVDLSVQLGSVKLANPVLTASGTCGYGFELSDFVDLSRLGGFITKSITVKPREGNPPQRTLETAAGMLNAIGLANVGLERFVAERVDLLEKMGVPVIVNVAGKSIDEYVAVAERLADLPAVAGLELNLGCPNVKQGGITFGTNPSELGKLVGAVRKRCPGTLLIVKLTPNVTDIAVPALAAVEAGGDVLSLVNTFQAMAIDIDRRKPVLGNRTGGLSGPAIKPIALYMVNRVYQEVAKSAGVPIIGLGGITGPSEALEFIIAGASAVSIGTGVLVDPGCLVRTIDGIEKYLIDQKIASVRELVGTLG